MSDDLTSSDGIAARQVAFHLLNDIYFRRRTLDEAMAQAEGFNDLPARDRAFVRLLIATVLKRTAQLDTTLSAYLHEPVSALKPATLINIFRLGMAQFIFLKTAAHAAVNTTVSLAEAEGIAHHKPLVNAIMRRLVREPPPEMADRDAGKLNTPAWLWQTWMQDYGVETALDIAAANLGEAALDITVKNNPAQWAEKLDATLLPTGSLRKYASGFIPDLPGFADGEWWVQNAVAALPALLFGDLRGKTVIDLCAAPGGKTAQLASAGATVTALDRSAMRLMRLRENMERLKLNVETVTADGASWLPPAPVDAVLLDAPCTATGTIRHQPDLLHLKDPKDQDKLAALQRRLIKQAALMLKPGGTLVYCTCSLQKAEGEYQMDWLNAEDIGLKPSPITGNDINGIDTLLNDRGEIRALPSHWADIGGCDGFFIARYSKI